MTNLTSNWGLISIGVEFDVAGYCLIDLARYLDCNLATDASFSKAELA